jgi:hypothetical protein
VPFFGPPIARREKNDSTAVNKFTAMIQSTFVEFIALGRISAMIVIIWRGIPLSNLCVLCVHHTIIPSSFTLYNLTDGLGVTFFVLWSWSFNFFLPLLAKKKLKTNCEIINSSSQDEKSNKNQDLEVNKKKAKERS